MQLCVCSESSLVPTSRDNFCVRQRNHGNRTSCCRGQVYDNRYSKCCDGVLHPLTGHYTGCCGGESYNPSSHLCCPDKKIIRKLYGPHTACCGLRAYEYTSQGCCNGYVYDLDDYVCCHSLLRRKDYGSATGCCDHYTYNRATHVCCSGVVRPKSHDWYTRCCGIETHDYRYHVCCGGYLKERTDHKDAACCGHEVYSFQSDTCCGGHIVNKSHGDRSRCCGDKVIDSQYYSCCGEKSYSTYTPTKICCDGELSDRVFGSYTTCCKTAVYDIRKSRCCNGLVHSKSDEPYPKHCCGANLYLPYNEICCKNCRNVHPEVSSHSGGLEFNQNSPWKPNKRPLFHLQTIVDKSYKPASRILINEYRFNIPIMILTYFVLKATERFRIIVSWRFVFMNIAMNG